MTGTEEVEHQARQLLLSNVPSVKSLEHQARELTLRKVPSVKRSVHQARELTLRKVPSVERRVHKARELTLRKVPSVERRVHQANQLILSNVPSVNWLERQTRKLTLSSNFCINLRCLTRCLMILVFSAPMCTCNEDIRSTYPERYETKRGNFTNESTMIHSEDTLSGNKITCNKGQYLNVTKRECFSCPRDTFIPEDNHTNRDCIECTVDLHSHQQILLPANGTHGPIFGCIYGYYSEDFRHDKHMCNKSDCSKCTNCTVSNEYERRPCSNESDAVCCEEEDMVVVSGRCTRKETTPSPLPANSTTTSDVVCDRNYYMNISNNTCQKCPPNTYLDRDNHTSPVCFNCSEVMVQNKTSGCSPEERTSGNGHNEDANGISVPVLIVIVVLLVVPVIIVVSFWIHRRGRCHGVTIHACCRKKGPQLNGASSPESRFIQYFHQSEIGSMIGNDAELEPTSVL